MADFPLHTRATAPFASKPFLEQAQSNLGYVPALVAQMAESPQLLEGYVSLSAIFGKSTFTPAEQQLVLLTISVENDSHYCTPAHTRRARHAAMAEADIRSIRDGRPLSDPRMEALRSFTLLMVRERGFLADADVNGFLSAGFTRAQVLDVVLAVGLKTLSNYVNHLAETPLDIALAGDAADQRVA
ncbi:MAG: carboxymuconolactone decarboxylase family protein [Caulobacter sp.]|nr:carboxymuconolactone decarboxylase family protein [Caulobacter sp.]